MMNAALLWYHIGKGRWGPLSHLVIPLVGIFKGETIIRHQQ